MTDVWQNDETYDAAKAVARHYINHIGISFSLSEVQLDLGQYFPIKMGANRPVSDLPNTGLPGIVAQCQLVTSPVHLQRIGGEIATALQHYRAEFGAIPECPPLDSDATEGGKSHGAA